MSILINSVYCCIYNFFNQCYEDLNNMITVSKVKVFVAAAAVAVTCAYTGCLVFIRLKKPRRVPATEAFKLDINVVCKPEECAPLIYELRRRSMQHNAIGFDCEWVTKGSGRKPVALLQLSTYDGYCVLFRLNLMDSLPQSLIQLLEDISIHKVGVVPLSDANYLYQDHGLRTVATLDLRHFAEMCDSSVGGLAHLSETHLGVVLNKSFKVRCGDWDAETLSPAQLHYAASDAHAAIRIFVKLVNELDRPSRRRAWCSPDCDDSIWDVLDDVCAKYTDYNYKHINNKNQSNDVRNRKTEKKPKDPMMSKRYPHLIRSKPLYDNCKLQAPDGELLSTCDTRKALWYIDKGLADLIDQDPLTVRLRFEPAGRSVGDVGKYYTIAKKNHCVVCGETDSYIRKNVVPREYRKCFPDIMKDHSSHDVVLLCAPCHQRSNMRDQTMRERLALQCRAPLPNTRDTPVEEPRAKKVRMAARALYQCNNGKHVIPEARRRELQAVVLDHYTEHEEITDALLEEATKLSIIIEHEQTNIESHGQGVVNYFLKMEEKGLLRLEEVWRTHFLTCMRPQHLPELWSVTHSEDRLRVKWNEGRLSREELHSIGIEGW